VKDLKEQLDKFWVELPVSLGPAVDCSNGLWNLPTPATSYSSSSSVPIRARVETVTSGAAAANDDNDEVVIVDEVNGK